MDRISSAWSKLAVACLAALGSFHLYRSMTLAITTDEAFTLLDFVSVSWLKLATSYDANHHVLHSVLCKLSTGLFGVAEWSLRLPAVLGGWLYFAFAWRLSRRLCGEGPAMLAGVLWMSCLPQIAEYLSVARGYSLGLAFWTAAMFYALEEEPKLRRVSALLGLSVASNLVFAIPCAALGSLLWIKTRETRQLIAPALAVIVVFLAVPLQRVDGEHYYFGAKNWESALHSLLFYPWLKGAAGVVGLMALVLARKSAGNAMGSSGRGVEPDDGGGALPVAPCAFALRANRDLPACVAGDARRDRLQIGEARIAGGVAGCGPSRGYGSYPFADEIGGMEVRCVQPGCDGPDPPRLGRDAAGGGVVSHGALNGVLQGSLATALAGL